MATLLDYCAAIDRLNTTIDRVLASGQSAQNRYDQFCQRHSIHASSGTLAKTAAALSSDKRHIHAGLIALWEKLHTEHAIFPPSAPARETAAPSLATASRALASHTRL